MKIKSLLLALVMALGTMAITTTAQAQLSIELGGSNADIKRMLNSKGYSEIAITSRRLTTTIAKACMDGIRYQMKILITGKIKWRKEIGRCERTITIQEARRLLQQDGYNRIDIEPRRNAFVAIACLGNDRLRVSVDRHGRIRQDRRIGNCRPDALSPTDITANLKEQGYTRIKFIDRQLPRYVAEACQGLKKVELVLNRRGEIRQERSIGQCRRAISPRELPRILTELGYRRIKIIDDKLPRYVAEACRRNELMEITLNRFGQVIDQFSLGQCRRPVTRKKLLESLADQGFKRINLIREDKNGFIVDACSDDRQIRISYNQYGEVVKQRDRGLCKSRTVREITKALSNRGMTRYHIFVEGCRKGRKLRIEFNRFGDPIGRTRLGRC